MKALDGYSTDLEKAVENLNYAISYDDEHKGAHFLLAKCYLELMHDLDKAEQHFKYVLSLDARHVETYELYTRLLLNLEEYEKAQNLIDHAYKQKGIPRVTLLHLEALIQEYQRNWDNARILLNEARMYAYSKTTMEFIHEELDRIEEKMRG